MSKSFQDKVHYFFGKSELTLADLRFMVNKTSHMEDTATLSIHDTSFFVTQEEHLE